MMLRPPPRLVTPELLDDLDPRDPRALRSRRDLQRVHRAMRSVSILRRLIHTLQLPEPPRTIIELGAGDGTLLLRLAASFSRWTDVSLTLLDRHDLLAAETLNGYRKLGWTVSVAKEDVLRWSRGPIGQRYDLCIVNLFLHHFNGDALRSLLQGSAARSERFIACEPRRDRLGRLGSRCVGLLGANSVTREDAVKSVDAGFTGVELTELWAAAPGAWTTNEFRAFPFTHCFSATRSGAPRGW